MLSPAVFATHLVSRGALSVVSIFPEEPLKLNAQAPPTIVIVTSIIIGITDNIFIIVISFVRLLAGGRSTTQASPPTSQ